MTVDLDQTAPTAGQGRDLRDVVVSSSFVYVSQLRSATILTLDKTLVFKSSTPIVLPSGTSPTDAAPDVAWHMVKRADEGLQVVYQVASKLPIDVATPPGISSYGGNGGNTLQEGPSSLGGGAVVTAAVASFAPNGNGTNSWMVTPLATNPVVDVAVDAHGNFETIAVTGDIETTASTGNQNNNGFNQPAMQLEPNALNESAPNMYVAIADATSATNPVVVVQRRGPSPALLVLSASNGNMSLVGAPVALPQKMSHVDTGFDVFHMPTSAGIACMNCHAEGGDDGHVWQFQLSAETRIRRTQDLRGGIVTSSAPYHWDGDMTDIQALCDEVFTHRMGGGAMTNPQTLILSRFLNAIPRVPVKATLDQDAVAQGQAIFAGAGGCTTCHTGPGKRSLQTIGKTDANESTKALQVPILVGVADRAPYMHDGCAGTLMDRLQVNACAGMTHGNVGALSTTDKQNLIVYLQSL